MTENRKHTRRYSGDEPDNDIPDMSTPYWVERFSKVEVQRGRPKSAAPKVSTTIRLSPEVLEHFRATGPGWQTRIDEALKAAIAAREDPS